MSDFIYAHHCFCQSCLKRFRLDNEIITTVVNMDITGFEKDGFVSDSLNKITCPYCSTKFTFETKMIIFSYRRNYAIYVDPNSKNDVLLHGYTPGHLFRSDFKFRIVNYLIEAREKSRIFEEGSSDADIEYIKLKKFNNSQTVPFDEINMIYSGSENGLYKFRQYDFNDNLQKEYCIDMNKNDIHIPYCNPDKLFAGANKWLKINRFTIDNINKGEKKNET